MKPKPKPKMKKSIGRLEFGHDRKVKFLEKCSCCCRKIHKDMPRFTERISLLYGRPRIIHLCARCILKMSNDVKVLDLDFDKMDADLFIKML